MNEGSERVPGRVQDKTVILTGAGSGIGRGIAKLFAQEGARLFLVGRDEQKLKETVQELGQDAEIVVADISNEQAVDSLRECVEKQTDRVDILINNAGTVMRNENIMETNSQLWDEFMSINLKGPFLLCKAFLPLMVRQNQGSIVNIASQLATVSAPGYSTYSTAKGGIVSFTRSIAVDFGAHNIRANCVSPGVVETPMAYVGRENFDELKDAIGNSLPLKRIGQSEDIAYAVLYLASDESSWVTGTNLVVDGGFISK